METLSEKSMVTWEFFQQLKGQTVQDVTLRREGDTITDVTLKFTNKRAVTFNISQRKT